MVKALASFGAAITVACIIIYPKPTLFVLVVVLVTAWLYQEEEEDNNLKK